ncbi:MAG: tyrosine-type recombinase/integrase [Acidobacteria bacterium]|nr:tyrosine-type recombinase/integrase [Acidobacteriota bacterium]
MRSSESSSSSSRLAAKRVRIIKKVRVTGGVWKFVSLGRIGNRYVWDKRPGCYFLEWWDGRKRRRERAGETPSQALEAQRRKRNELIGEMAARGKVFRSPEEGGSASLIERAIELFEEHVKAHSPTKPATLQRYHQVLDHFERILGKKKYIEAITRSDIDDYKIARSHETVGDTGRPVSASTINFEITVLRTLFYYFIRERGSEMENPCSRFKPLRAERERLKRRPPTYNAGDLDKIFAECSDIERAMFAALYLTGLRKEELAHLTWNDLDLKRATLRLTAKEGFAPKDYEEREIPMPEDLVAILKKLPRTSTWVFPSRKGRRLGRNEMLRRLKAVAKRVGVKDATLHRFRHTYATRLLENGSDIVTVQHLLGHSDLDTTRKYLSPDEDLKRQAVSKLSLKLKG